MSTTTKREEILKLFSEISFEEKEFVLLEMNKAIFPISILDYATLVQKMFRTNIKFDTICESPNAPVTVILHAPYGDYTATAGSKVKAKEIAVIKAFSDFDKNLPHNLN